MSCSNTPFLETAADRLRWDRAFMARVLRLADYSPPAGDLRTVANNLEYNEKMAAFRDYRRNHNELASWMEETVSLAWHHTCFDPAMDIGEWYRALKYKAKRPYEE